MNFTNEDGSITGTYSGYGLTATNVYATNYLNLPTDKFVNSGTYSAGVLTLTHNTGTTFSVGGFRPVRSYASVSLANNTNRTPSATKDMMIILTPSLQAGIGQTAQVIVQVDNNGGGTFMTIATATNTNALTITLGLLGGASTQLQPITFIVPKTCQYRYVTSGAGTSVISSHFEMEL